MNEPIGRSIDIRVCYGAPFHAATTEVMQFRKGLARCVGVVQHALETPYHLPYFS
jgi:hypothetical protein